MFFSFNIKLDFYLNQPNTKINVCKSFASMRMRTIKSVVLRVLFELSVPSLILFHKKVDNELG